MSDIHHSISRWTRLSWNGLSCFEARVITVSRLYLGNVPQQEFWEYPSRFRGLAEWLCWMCRASINEGEGSSAPLLLEADYHRTLEMQCLIATICRENSEWRGNLKILLSCSISTRVGVFSSGILRVILDSIWIISCLCQLYTIGSFQLV